MSQRIAVIGLGTIGGPIARHVTTAGHDVTVHNRTRDRELPFAEMGAKRAETPAAAAQSADVVITCVSDTPDLQDVLLGPNGVAETLAGGALVIDCSTVSPTATAGIAGQLAERSIGMVDAPVSGGSEGAERGTLTIFAGGEPRDVERARPILETFGSRITHLGPSGAGQMAKAVNQVIISGIFAGVAEGVALAEAAGLPPEPLLEALSGGVAGSWVLENRAPRMFAGTYPLGFRTTLHRKDLRIALEEGEKRGLPLDVAHLVASLEDSLIEHGYGEEDMSALARSARAQIGTQRLSER